MRALAAVALCALAAAAGERPLRPDRPQATPTPFTVEAGGIQVELGFFRFTRDREHVGTKGTRLRMFNLMAFDLKAGLADDLDVEVAVQPLLFERLEIFDPTTSVEREGFGDTTVRAKWSLWGNDGEGRSALGLLPFVRIPTAQDEIGGGKDDVEGGLIVPFALELDGRWDLGLAVEASAVRNSMDTSYVARFGQSAYVRRELLPQVAGYVEITSAVTGESGAHWLGALNLGLSYAVTGDVTLDVGGSIGLSGPAPDSSIFAGVTLRF